MSGMTKAKDAICLQFNLVAGAAAANTDMAISGIKTTDQILFAGHFTTAAAIATLADLTSTVSITSDGNIQSTTDIVNDQLFVIWLKCT
jgi:hypothetical protein